jgi:hypothetical protein
MKTGLAIGEVAAYLPDNARAGVDQLSEARTEAEARLS